MTIEKQRELCATGIMGWRKAKAEFSDNDFWLIPNTDGKTARVGPRLADYHPDLNDPKSREQANELWKKIDDDYHWSVENDLVGNKHFWIMDKTYNDKLHGYDILAMGKGKTWEAALVNACAKLVAERSKK